MGVQLSTNTAAQQQQQRRNSFRFRYSDPQQSNQPTQTSVSRAAAASTSHGHSEVFQGATQLRAACEGRGADQVGAPQQGALHHREVRRREAAVGAGQEGAGSGWVSLFGLRFPGNFRITFQDHQSLSPNCAMSVLNKPVTYCHAFSSFTCLILESVVIIQTNHI